MLQSANDELLKSNEATDPSKPDLTDRLINFDQVLETAAAA